MLRTKIDYYSTLANLIFVCFAVIPAKIMPEWQPLVGPRQAWALHVFCNGFLYPFYLIQKLNKWFLKLPANTADYHAGQLIKRAFFRIIFIIIIGIHIFFAEQVAYLQVGTPPLEPEERQGQFNVRGKEVRHVFIPKSRGSLRAALHRSFHQ